MNRSNPGKFEDNNKVGQNYANGTSTNGGNSDLGKTANEMYQTVKDKASDMYEEGKKSLHDAEASLKEYTHQLSSNVKEKPLTSLLIAGGIGFILAALLKK